MRSWQNARLLLVCFALGLVVAGLSLNEGQKGPTHALAQIHRASQPLNPPAKLLAMQNVERPKQSVALIRDPALVIPGTQFDRLIRRNWIDMFKEGRSIFRFDTFGDETWWGDTLQLHQAIEGAKLGGVGPGVSPNTALAVGLKVDVQALPQSVIKAI